MGIPPLGWFMIALAVFMAFTGSPGLALAMIFIAAVYTAAYKNSQGPW